MSLKSRSFSVRARQSLCLVTACVALCMVAPLAGASTFSADFEGDVQTFHGSVDLTGNLNMIGGITTGNGATKKQADIKEPFDHPLVLFGFDENGDPVSGPVVLDSHPTSIGLPQVPAPSRFDHVDGGDDVFVYYDPKTHNVLLNGDGDPLTFKVVGGVPTVAPPTVNDAPNTRFDLNGTNVQNITDLDLDNLNGVTAPFALETIHVLTTAASGPFKDITLDAAAELLHLTFEQTGVPVLTPTGANTGTFLVPGSLSALIGNFNITAFNALDVAVDDQDLNQHLDLAGTYTVTDVDPNTGKRSIKLDGSTNLSLPLELSSVVSYALTGVLEITTTISLAASVTIGFGYHLESELTAVPEPGSIVLLAIGAVGCLALVVRKRKA